MTKQTVRFWHHHKGAVLIKLAAGQTVRHFHAYSTDEGWGSETTSYYFDGRTIECAWSTDGRDCDGRMTRGGLTYCPASQAQAGYHDAEYGITFPAWQEGESTQRDYSAEAMGY
jgi:hypothetical protein